MFHLCKTSAETAQQTPCRHTDEDRSFIGSWVTEEVKKAVQMGHMIAKIYEVWHFDQVSQYDPKSKTGGLFTEYVNTFLKIKQELVDGRNRVGQKMIRTNTLTCITRKRGFFFLQQNKSESWITGTGKAHGQLFLGKFGQT